MKYLFLITLLAGFLITHAQKPAVQYDDKNFAFIGNSYVDLRHATPAQLQELATRKQLIAISKDRFLFSVGEVIYSGSESLAIRFQQNTGSTVYAGIPWAWGNIGYLRRFILTGPSSIEFADVKITAQTAKNYRYHVVSNDNKEIIPWTTPRQFKKTVDGKAVYAYLGNFPPQTNGYLKIEIYNINNYRDRNAIMVDWRPIKSVKIEAGVEYLRTQMPGTLIYTPLIWKLKNKALRKLYDNIVDKENVFHLADSLVRIAFRLDYTGNYLLKTELIRKINGKTEKLDLEDNKGSLYLYKEYWKNPGDYEIVFTPKLQHPGGSPVAYLKDQSVQYKFTVLPALNSNRLYTKKEISVIAVLLCAIFGAVLLVSIIYIKKKGKQRLAAEQQQKELSRLQLYAIRSQLNPHFMFNALAGIQNLMNKDKIDEANRYLGKFARLTRNVLDNKELVSLAEERALLEDYLQMEQLRFGFAYQINIANDIDADNMEIPSMLLQPFVENAVKHGIAEKEINGRITIYMIRKDQDLILRITDNGKGFDVTKNYDGFGLQLTKNRISLLNTIYTETPFVLDIRSDGEKTEITITLTQWL